MGGVGQVVRLGGGGLNPSSVLTSGAWRTVRVDGPQLLPSLWKLIFHAYFFRIVGVLGIYGRLLWCN